jgi:hypothetical protein
MQRLITRTSEQSRSHFYVRLNKKLGLKFVLNFPSLYTSELAVMCSARVGYFPSSFRIQVLSVVCLSV